MNRIYKVIWSKVKHQYVVVSELAHRDGKQSKSEKTAVHGSLRALAAALMVSGAIMITPYTALAAETVDNSALATEETTAEEDTEETPAIEPKDITTNNGITVIEGEDANNDVNYDKVSGENAVIVGAENSLFNKENNAEAEGVINNSVISGIGNEFYAKNQAYEQNPENPDDLHDIILPKFTLTIDNSIISGNSNEVSLNLNNVQVYGNNINLRTGSTTNNSKKISIENSTLIGSDIEAIVSQTSDGKDNSLTNLTAIGHNLTNLSSMNSSVVIGNGIQGGSSGSVLIGNNFDAGDTQEKAVIIGNDTVIKGSTGSANPYIVIGTGNEMYGQGGSSSNIVGRDVVIGNKNIIGADTDTDGSVDDLIVGNENILSNQASSNNVFGNKNNIKTDTEQSDIEEFGNNGNYVTANTNGNNTVIGYQNILGDNTSQIAGAVLMGSGSKAYNSGTVTMGTGAINRGYESIAIGRGASIGTSKNNIPSDIGEADYSIAIGSDAKVYYRAKNSVALGANSTVKAGDLKNTYYSYYLKGEWNYDSRTAKDRMAGVVSVGTSSESGDKIQTRRIINVERGIISADSFDAVNGSQLRNYAFGKPVQVDDTPDELYDDKYHTEYEGINWIDKDKDGVKDTLTLDWKDQYGIGEDWTTELQGVASQEWVDKQIEKNGGGSWNLTTTANGEESTPATIGKGDKVNISNTDGNITLTQEEIKDGDNVVGTKVNFGLADKVTTKNMYVTNVDTTSENSKNSVINLGYFNANEKHIATPADTAAYPEGGYKVDKNAHTVTLVEAKGDGTATGNNVVITDVASAEDLSDVKTDVDTGWVAKINGDTEVKNVKPNTENEKDNNVLNFEAGDNIALSNENGSIGISAVGVVSYDKTGDGYNTNSVTLEGTPYVKGNSDTGTRVTNVAYADVNGENTGSDAVNVDLLKDYVDEKGGGAWNLTTNGGEAEADKSVSVGKGTTVDFSADDDNVTISKDGTNVKIGLSDELNVNKVTTNNMYVTNVDTTSENSKNSVINLGYFNANEKHIATPADTAAYPEGGYKVDKNAHTVTLVEAKGDGTATGNNVVITDVASAEDLSDVKTDVDTGWVAKINGDTEVKNVKPNTENEKDNNVLNFEAGDNIALSNENGSIGISAVGVVSYDKTGDGYNTNSVTLEGTPYVKGNSDTGTRVTNVAYADVNGENTGSDAVNVDLLKDYVDEKGGGAWNLTTNGGEAEADKSVSVGKGTTVDFSADDDNVTISKDGTNVKIGLSDELNVNKVTTNNMYVTNVDTTSENSKNSVINLGYFNANEKHIATPADTAAYPEGGYKVDKNAHTVTLVEAKGDGTATGNNVVITDVASAEDLSDVKTDVDTGWVAKINGDTEVKNVKPNTENEKDNNVLNFEAGDNIALSNENGSIGISAVGVVSYDKTGDGYNTNSVTLEGTPYVKGNSDTGTRVTNVAYADVNGENTGSDAVNVDLLKDYVDEKGGGAWNLTTNGGEAEADKSVSVGKGTTVDFSADDDNVTISKDGTNVKIGLSDELNVNKVTTNNMYVTNVDTTSENSKNSVINLGYFNANEKHIATPADTAAYPEGGYKVDKNAHTVTLVEAKGDGTATGNNVVITDVASAEDLSDVKTDVDNGWSATDKDNHKINVNPTNNTLAFMGDDNVNVTADETGRAIRVGLADVVTVGTSEAAEHPVKIDGVNGTITGLTNTTTDYTGFATKGEGKAATEEQLKSVMDDMDTIEENSYKGWNVSANNENSTTVASGKTVDFSGKEYEAGKSNITVTKTDDENGNTKLTFDLNDKLVLGENNQITIDASDGNATINLGDHITMDGNTGNATFGGVTINNTYKEDGSVSSSTVNNLTNTSWDIDNITSGQAATEDQLQQAVNKINENAYQGWKVSVNGGEDVLVEKGDIVDFSSADNAEGTKNVVITQDGTNLTFDLSDRIVLGDSTSPQNQILLDGMNGSAFFGGISGVSISRSAEYGNGYIISGLANTTWTYGDYAAGKYKDSNKAATEAQLHSAFDYLDNRIDSMEIDSDENITVTHPDSEKPGSSTGGEGEGGTTTTPGTGTGNGNHYIELNDDIVLGTTDENGKVTNPGSLTVKDPQGHEITINKDLDGDGLRDGVISGMTNTTWDYNKYQEGGYATSSNAATEAQLHQALGGTVQYDRNEDGSVNKGSITLNEGGTTIHNVAPGEVSESSMDAVNGSQLYGVQQQVDNNSNAINNMGNQINRLGDRIDKVGAGAAALAALHPLDFDPDDKLSFAAGYGNYAGENAVAIGAFYQPNEDTLFSVGGTVGNDENMVNVGVSFKLGQKNHVSNSRVAMAKEVISLRDEVAQLKALMAHSGVLPANGQIDTSALFPDVPENHWAYEYVHELAKLGIVEGYPDGNFDGDRMMTRYEFAAIVYRAMQKGVNVDRRMLSEFEPELKLIRVDVVAKDRDGNPTIERVRVNEPEQQQA